MRKIHKEIIITFGISNDSNKNFTLFAFTNRKFNTVVVANFATTESLLVSFPTVKTKSTASYFHLKSSVCVISIFENANSFFPKSLIEAPIKYTVLSMIKKRS